MNQANLATLERVDVRCAWPHEAQDFTPWLANNLDRLAPALGLGNLERAGEEVQVGPYWADIVARIPQDGAKVLIENQLECADLQHLGQILAYQAGLNAQIIVWVATDFLEPHLAAIRWLNEHTDDPFGFFAVRLSLVQIEDSPLAPVFTVLERPNAWLRPSGLSESGRLHRDFWEHLSARRPDAPKRSGYANSYMRHLVQEAKLNVTQYLTQSSAGVALQGVSGDMQENVQPKVERFRKALQHEFEGDRWDDGSFLCGTNIKVDSRDRNNWDRMADWLDDTRQTYERVLRSSLAPTD